MVRGALVLVTAALSCLLAGSSAHSIDALTTINDVALDVDRQQVNWPTEVKLIKRGKAKGLERREKQVTKQKRVRPFRMPGLVLPPITDEFALRTSAVTAGLVAAHAAAIGVSILPPVDSAASAVGYLALHTAVAGAVAPTVYRATKAVIAKTKACVGPFCQQLYDGVRRPTTTAKEEIAEADTTTKAEIHPISKKGGRRNAKALKAPTRSSVLAGQSQMPSSRVHLVKRGIPPGLKKNKIYQEGTRKRERPYKIRRLNLPVLTGQDGMASATMAVTTVAAHGGAIHIRVLPPIETVPMAMGALALHGVAAGLVAPHVYRASKEMLTKAKECIGPYCSKAYQALVGSASEGTSEMQEGILSAVPDMDHLAKKGGRRIKRVVTARTLSKRSLVTPPSINDGGIVLQRRGMNSIKKSYKDEISVMYKDKVIRHRNGPSDISTRRALRAIKWTTGAALSHGALIATGTLPPIQSAPEMAGMMAVHAAVAGGIGPIVYDKAMGMLRDCVGPYCMRKLNEVINRMPAEEASRARIEMAERLALPEVKPSAPFRPVVQGSTKKASRKAKGKVLAKRSTSVDGDMVLVKRRGKRESTGYATQKLVANKNKITLPRNGPPNVSTEGALRTVVWTTGAAVTHGALITAGALPNIESGPGLASALAVHTAVAGVIAPIVYDKVKQCIGPYCLRKLGNLIDGLPQEEANKYHLQVAEILNGPSVKPTSPVLQGSTKKASRRARVNAAAKGKVLAKRSRLDDLEEDCKRSGTLVRRAVRGGGKSRTVDVVKKPKRKRPLPRNDTPAVNLDTLARTFKYTSAAVLGHCALVAAGALHPIESVPSLAGTLIFHTAVAGVVGPVVYDKAVDMMKKCVGPYCQKVFNRMTAQPSTSKETRVEEARRPAAKETPRRVTQLGTKAFAAQSKMGMPLKRRSLPVSFDEVVLRKRGSKKASKSHLDQQREGFYYRKLKVPTGPPAPEFRSLHISDRAVANGAIRVASTLTAHGASIAVGLADPIRTPGELAFTVGRHVALSGFLAPVIYEAGGRIKKCVGSYCSKFNHNESTPTSQSTATASSQKSTSSSRQRNSRRKLPAR